MAQHELFIELDVQDMAVRSKDVVFKVYRNGDKFGELRVSQGAVVWWGRSDKIGRKLGWAKFAEFMEAEGRRAERRPPAPRTVRKKKRR